MKPPFIFNDHGDVTVYRNIAEVKDYIEIIDIIQGAYTIYDSEGQQLHGVVQEGKISLQEDTESLKKVEELRNLLQTYLINVGIIERATENQALQWLTEQLMFYLVV